MDEIIKRLHKWAATDVQQRHWLTGGGSEPSCTYCYSCAVKAAAAHPGSEIDGGWPGEEDGCLHCDTCGCLIEYSLTDYGASSEIDHFRSARFRTSLSRIDAYHLARMIEAAPNSPDAKRIVKRAARWIPDATLTPPSSSRSTT